MEHAQKIRLRPEALGFKINIFTGHFGSGKSEIAVNFALKLSHACYPRVALADLDIVNPFFRSADARHLLENEGVLLVTTGFANTNVDVPALPSAMDALFEDPGMQMVLDIGGDDLGARVVSRYHREIAGSDHVLYVVVNTRRPETDTPKKVLAMLERIEASSRLPAAGLVNNTHLLAETRADILMEGQAILEEVSKIRGIPVAMMAGLPEVLAEVPDDAASRTLYGMLALKKSIRLPWDRT
ncbi:MAG TPA: hypothetical protein DD727_06365 [Clostridiales bacterium]|nr:hypothetical protein [Clostridiales bacterium]